jgi:hypothetical protein
VADTLLFSRSHRRCKSCKCLLARAEALPHRLRAYHLITNLGVHAAAALVPALRCVRCPAAFCLLRDVCYLRLSAACCQRCCLMPALPAACVCLRLLSSALPALPYASADDCSMIKNPSDGSIY